jgi:hypothetical protein
MRLAKERSDTEKKEIFKKWKDLINMTESELKSWAKDDERLLASLNRQEAKENGKIQSGYDSLHRIKRRVKKPFDEWTSEDFDNASQEIGFNSRMLGGTPGDPVSKTKSKWEISLKNWGHDPSKPNSPAHNKWKKWNKNMNKKAKLNLIKNAYIVSLRHPELRETSLLLSKTIRLHQSGKLASEDQEEIMSQPVDATDTMLEVAKKADKESPFKREQDVLSEFVARKGVAGVVTNAAYNRVVKGTLVKPSNKVEGWVFKVMNSLKGKSDIVRFLADLVAADNFEEVAQAGRMSVDQFFFETGLMTPADIEGAQKYQRDLIEYEEKIDSLTYFNTPMRPPALSDYVKNPSVVVTRNKITVSLDWFASIEDSKIFGVKLIFTALKGSLVAAVFGASLASIKTGVQKFLMMIIWFSALFGWRHAASFLRKSGVLLGAIAPSVVVDALRPFKFLSGVLSGFYNKLKEGFKSMFRKKALLEVNHLCSTNKVFEMELQHLNKMRSFR